MAKIVYVDVNGELHECDVDNGLSVLEGAIQNDIDGILASCGGSCACSTCHSYIDENWLERVGRPGDIEGDTLELAQDRQENSRLTCQIEVTDELDGLVVVVAQNDG